MPETPRDQFKATLKFYKNFNFFTFFVLRVVGSPLVKPHLKVYREANPLACTSELCHLTPEKSKK